jgi:Tol biopolymer transport system component
VWLLDLSRQTSPRLTFDATRDNSNPIWSADGTRIVFGARNAGKWGIYQKRADGSGDEELLLESDLQMLPMSWSADGRPIIYWVSNPETKDDLWLFSMPSKKSAPILNTRFSETQAQISPDGKWIAYRSDETGRNEIYVRPLAGPGKWQISTTGGTDPTWRRDGKELFYIRGGNLGTVMSVVVNGAGSAFEAGIPKPLFDSALPAAFSHVAGPFHSYAVSADGQRFLIPVVPTANASGGLSPPITVIVNWTAVLNKNRE